MGAVGEDVDAWAAALEAATGRTGLGPAALPGGLLIMTGGDGGRGAKLGAAQAAGLLLLGGNVAAAPTGDGGRELLFTGRGTVA